MPLTPVTARSGPGVDAGQQPPPLVLVVDDDNDIRYLITQVLQRHGCRVHQAVDADAALAFCESDPVDLAVVDIELPGMDGLELLRAMHDRFSDKHIPVVLVTARALASDVATGLGLGASDYLRKPFETTELLARIDAALKIKRLQDQLRRQNTELDRLTRSDSLTGVYNRRHLDDQLDSHWRDGRRHGHPLAVLMIDVDHFKQVNDRHGHPYGDHVLQVVARRLQHGLRAGDVLGRWGGEEFLVIAPRTGRSGAVRLAERLRAAVAATPANRDGITITVSIGVTATAQTEPAALIDAADTALYRAKTTGRNRVETEPPHS